LGIAKATMIMVGQEMGSGNPQRAFRVAFLSLKYALALCILASSMFLIFPEQLLSVFTSEQGLISESSKLLNIVSVTIFPVAVNVVIGNAIRGMKDTKWMFYTQSFGTIFTIVVSATLLFVFNMDLKGVFLTVLLDEFIRAFLNYKRFMWYMKAK
jgi:Na+-driven multidrug efflux pump